MISAEATHHGRRFSCILTISAIAMLVPGVTGCVQAMWGKQGATAADVAQDVQQCRSELPKAEAIYEESFVSRGYNVALERLRADPAAYAMYRADLLRLCLFSRGYRQVDMQELVGIQSYVPSPPGEDPK